MKNRKKNKKIVPIILLCVVLALILALVFALKYITGESKLYKQFEKQQIIYTAYNVDNEIRIDGGNYKVANEIVINLKALNKLDMHPDAPDLTNSNINLKSYGGWNYQDKEEAKSFSGFYYICLTGGKDVYKAFASLYNDMSMSVARKGSVVITITGTEMPERIEQVLEKLSGEFECTVETGK